MGIQEWETVVQWAMSNIYDDTNLLNDSIKYFGFLDDISVADAAIAIMNFT